LGRKSSRGVRLPRRQRLFVLQGGRCALTGLSLAGQKVHVDHILPVSRGGSDEDSNLQLVVRQANMAKGNDTVEEFRAWLLAAADSLRAKLGLEALL
jgi:CRISPR/Cas system Type II protein with McrA/HNH and RuvC-like nuclease domain